jgi:hypothetical protein
MHKQSKQRVMGIKKPQWGKSNIHGWDTKENGMGGWVMSQNSAAVDDQASLLM